MDLKELRQEAWRQYVDTLRKLDEVENVYRNATTKFDLLRAKLLADLCERRIRIIDRVISRTDPVKVLQSMSYSNVLHIITEDVLDVDTNMKELPKAERRKKG